MLEFEVPKELEKLLIAKSGNLKVPDFEIYRHQGNTEFSEDLKTISYAIILSIEEGLIDPSEVEGDYNEFCKIWKSISDFFLEQEDASDNMKSYNFIQKKLNSLNTASEKLIYLQDLRKDIKIMQDIGMRLGTEQLKNIPVFNHLEDDFIIMLQSLALTPKILNFCDTLVNHLEKSMANEEGEIKPIHSLSNKKLNAPQCVLLFYILQKGNYFHFNTIHQDLKKQARIIAKLTGYSEDNIYRYWREIHTADGRKKYYKEDNIKMIRPILEYCEIDDNTGIFENQ